MLRRLGVGLLESELLNGVPCATPQAAVLVSFFNTLRIMSLL